jgi:hypothetical protein
MVSSHCGFGTPPKRPLLARFQDTLFDAGTNPVQEPRSCEWFWVAHDSRHPCIMQHQLVWAHSRRSLHLHIENTGSQPLASAFFKLPNLVCGRSESPQSALCVDNVKEGMDHDDRQNRA